MEKQCERCGKTMYVHGLRKYCSVCNSIVIAERNRRRYQQNRDKIREQQRQYYLKQELGKEA